MKQKLRKVKIQWFFLFCFVLFCPGPVLGQQEQSDSIKTKDLDLILRKMNAGDFNGSSYTISGDEIRNLPVSNLTNLLGGRVPGFYSRQTQGGVANESPRFWIRGSRTNFEGVLVLVDGQERDFGILSPEEIESITILKDAAATVLYGMLGTNGVILVTTRKGAIGKPTLQFTAQMVNQKPVNLLKPLNALGYAENYNMALKRDGMDETNMYSQYYLSKYRNPAEINAELYPDINWLDDYFTKSNWMNRYNLNISGGSKRTRYFVNSGILTQLGMFTTDKEFDYNTNNNVSRYNLRSNVEFDVTSTTLLAVDLYGVFEKQNQPGNGSYGAYYALASTPPNSFPAYITDQGNYTDQSGNFITSVNNKIIAGNGIKNNPWAILNRNGYSIENSTYGSFRTKLTQDLSAVLPGLSASASLSMDAQTEAVTSRIKNYAYYQISDPENPDVLKKTGTDGKMANTVTDKNSNRRSTLDLLLSYDRLFGRHNISAIAFYNQYENSNEVSIPSRYQGVGGWLAYNFANRYGIDLMMNYQGAYKFAPDSRFGYFPAVAAGWTVSNEPFFEGLKNQISFLKFKASYGKTGNPRGIDEFSYIGRLNTTSGIYYFGNTMAGVGGYVEDIIANPGLTWEKSEQTNAGVEARFFKDQLSVIAEYFRDNRSDMYVTNSRISSILGVPTSVKENIGMMHSEGYDLAASWNSKIGDFGYSLGGTYSFSQNMITAFGGVDQPYPWLRTEGYSYGVKRGYIADGFFDSYEEIAAAPKQSFSEVSPGDIRYKDINRDGLIDVNDISPVGYSDIPEVFYGFHAGISFKGFGINALFQGTARVSRMMSERAAFPFYEKGNIYEHQLDYWTPESQKTGLSGISTINSGGVSNIQPSTFWIQDGDYLRLKTLEIYYEFPKSVFGKAIEGMRVFASGYNLYTWTSYNSPLDPDAEADGSGMPLIRNISFGLSIKF